jgi:(1->4)-alpha-D-glucan 1-alpha-D-glucosylmutase
MRIPTATYRLQFNKEFTFAHATAIVPYLASLGISHCYASPILQARLGSMHGYDIIDHRKLNVEVGTRDEFNQLVDTLRAHNMGLIVDFVPNHMGIGKNNPWWMDVLENGPASQYADYFDIDWEPVRKELYGKVLIPVLGNQYGDVLNNGELNLSFDVEKGTLALNYYEHSFPVNPVSYAQVLGLRLDELREQLGDDNFDMLEYLSILTALERLPDHIQPVGYAQRVRERKVQTKRLAMLCVRNPQVAEFIRENLKLFKVEKGDEKTVQQLHALVEAQAYRLAYWRVASDEINYRRFFDVNDLAAIRTEDIRVFNDIHWLMLELLEEGRLDGIRIDHPDGLFDPAAYFKRLQTAAARRLKLPFQPEKVKTVDDGGASLPAYVLVEKILAPFEMIEPGWMVQGTTGYDFLDSVNNLLVAEENEERFNQLYREFTGISDSYEVQKARCKNLILRTVLASELNMLAHRLDRIAESNLFYRDYTLSSLRRALREVIVQFPVYRTYANFNEVEKTVLQYVDWSIALAKRYNDTAPAVFDFIRDVLTMELPEHPGEVAASHGEPLWQAVATFAMKFQQFTGPVTAKSVEDTLFYRYNRLVCLNEVGGEPRRFGTSASAFHRQNSLRQERTPYGMLATSTHDTKRSEDVRARLAVLSEMPDFWRAKVDQWASMNESHRTAVNEEPAPDRNDEYLIFQTIVGAMPAVLPDADATSHFAQRIKEYMVKAMREAKLHTSWVEQNQEYEQAVANYLDKILSPDDNNVFLADIKNFVGWLKNFGYANSMVQTLLKLTSPGVPDIYQGNEVWDFSLVDPDNRRPIDFKSRAKILSGLENWVQDLLPNDPGDRADSLQNFISAIDDGQLKLLVTAIGLHTRRTMPRLFDAGSYVPLTVTGEKATHVAAFARIHEHSVAIVAVPLKIRTLCGVPNPQDHLVNESSPFECLSAGDKTWGSTWIQLPEFIKIDWGQNAFTARRVSFEKQQIAVGKLFADFPVALLLTQNTDSV